MDSLILRVATRILTGLMLLFSIYMLLRGHNEPGGGFIGALVTSTAFVLYKFAYGTQRVYEALVISPATISMIGVLCAIIAGLMALLTQTPFLTGVWLPAYVEGTVSWPLSSVLLFDIGVYLAVVGAVMTIILTLEEDG